jgi:hypothetical protein
MSPPQRFPYIEFHIAITNKNLERIIAGITVKMQQKMTRSMFRDMLQCVYHDYGQLVSDINGGKVGDPAYNNVALKVAELAAILPSAIVEVDRNFERYGVDVDHDDWGIPMSMEEPVLCINLCKEEDGKQIYEVNLPDKFHSSVYEFLVQAPF